MEEKTIEARIENQDIKKISQIELNKFLKQETEKIYTSAELKERKIIILDTYDIFCSDNKYVIKYLFMKPTEEEFEKETVEESDIYLNTIEFELIGEKYKLIKIEKPEIF